MNKQRLLEFIKKDLEYKLSNLQDWTLKYNENIQARILINDKTDLEISIKNIKEQIELIKKLKDTTIEDIMANLEDLLAE
jgi:hypothetical protein